MIIYPQKPWADGQTFQHTASDGSVLTGVYDSGKNVWTFYRTNEDGSGSGALVTTSDVKTLNVRPTTVKDPRDATLITTQQDANWWIIDDLEKRARKAIISDTEPTYYPLYNEFPDKALIQGDMWLDTTTDILYWYDGSKWQVVSDDRPPIFSTDAPTEHPKFPNQPLQEGDFWFDQDRLELTVRYNGAWFPVSVTSAGISEEAFTYSINRINSIIEEVYLKNINQDDRLDVIEENIVELEEEIDAIAPSNERGEWTFNPAGVASPGNYAFLDSNTQPTERFDAAATIYVSTRDAQSTTHSFNNHKAGEYLQIFNKEDDGYGLYQITDIDDNSSSPNPFFAFTVDFVRSLVTAPKAEGRGRFKFFTIADGDPGAYVLKTGDEMTGNLKFKDNNQVQTRYLNSGQDSNLSIQRKGETKILVGSDNVQMQKPIKFVSGSFATANEHAIHKGYVDEQIAELLAKIEELEMASGQPENYRLRLQTRNYGSSSNIGDWLEFNSCFTSVTAPSAWKNLDIDAVSGQDGYFYVCFQDDTYSLNSTGTLHVIKEFDGSYSFYDSDRHSLALTVSNAEKCPDEYSNNKNIWRCNIQPDLYRSSYNESTLGAFSDREYLYVTFAGGSVTKVTS